MLLLDEPAAGVPREESKDLFAAIAGLSRDITVLFIEHDMDLVFYALPRASSSWSVAACWSKARPPRLRLIRGVRAVYLGKGHRDGALQRSLSGLAP